MYCIAVVGLREVLLTRVGSNNHLIVSKHLLRFELVQQGMAEAALKRQRRAAIERDDDGASSMGAGAGAGLEFAWNTATKPKDGEGARDASTGKGAGKGSASAANQGLVDSPSEPGRLTRCTKCKKLKLKTEYNTSQGQCKCCRNKKRQLGKLIAKQKGDNLHKDTKKDNPELLLELESRFFLHKSKEEKVGKIFGTFNVRQAVESIFAESQSGVRTISKLMTFDAYEAFAATPEGGKLKTQQIRKNWQEMLDSDDHPKEWDDGEVLCAIPVAKQLETWEGIGSRRSIEKSFKIGKGVTDADLLARSGAFLAKTGDALQKLDVNDILLQNVVAASAAFKRPCTEDDDSGTGGGLLATLGSITSLEMLEEAQQKLREKATKKKRGEATDELEVASEDDDDDNDDDDDGRELMGADGKPKKKKETNHLT